MNENWSLAVGERAFKSVMLRWVLAVIALVLIGACSDAKTAGKANFQKAIQAYWDTRAAICVSPPASTVPFDMDAGPSFFPRLRQRAEALVAAGLLTRTAESPVQPGAAERYRYAMTAAGEQALVKGAGTNRAPGDAFCGGKVRVKEVVNFTEPSDVLGVRISEVQYSADIEGLPAWAKNREVVAANPELAGGLRANGRRSVLVLRNDGWIDERLMRAQQAAASEAQARQ